MLFLWREPTVNMFSFTRGCHIAEPHVGRNVYGRGETCEQ